MGISCFWCGVLLYLALFLTPFPLVTARLPGGYLTVNSSTSWTNTLSAPYSVKFNDGSFAGIILSRGSPDLYYEYACACGFFYNQTYNSSLFAIFTVYYEEGNISESVPPEVVWSANPNNPVSVNATLQLTSERGLVLQDANGTIAWSTNITNKSVAALNLNDTCNLMLLDENNATIWQSFDHPTDTLVLGQKLMPGQNLTNMVKIQKKMIHRSISQSPENVEESWSSTPPSGPRRVVQRSTANSVTEKRSAAAPAVANDEESDEEDETRLKRPRKSPMAAQISTI
uniref:Bulb-type lectin domain-containing protein n=1 Tax=Fagus sylvatica TaxID=28930 RepID=A0A2N9FXS3_FAGSY